MWTILFTVLKEFYCHEIYQVETNINLIEKTQIMGGVKAVHCVVSGDVQHFAKNVMLVLGNNTVDVYEA